jgi:hypothetical protein
MAGHGAFGNTALHTDLELLELHGEKILFALK